MFIYGFLHDDFVSFIRSVPLRFAKAMPHMSHEYTLRKQAQELGFESHFESAVRLIRENGYSQRFGSKVYTYYDLPDEEGPLGSIGRWERLTSARS